MRSSTLTRHRPLALPLPRIARWLQVSAERRKLKRLDAEQLADLGLTPQEAAREAARPFWDLPRGR